MKQKVLLVAVTLLLAIGYSNAGMNQEAKTDAVASATAQVGEIYATLKVEGLCDMCKARIEETAKAVEGVTIASWDQKTKEVYLHYDAAKTGVEAVSKAIAKVGYDTEKDKADDKTYATLPGCCKYRKIKK